MVDELRKFVDPFGNILGRRPTVRNVIFDPVIGVDAAGVVAGGENQPTEGLSAADDRRHSGGGEDAAVGDQHPPKLVSDGDVQNLLDGFLVVIPPVAAHHQGGFAEVTVAHGVEDRLYKCLDVPGLHELPGLFPQTGRSGPLTGERFHRNRCDI